MLDPLTFALTHSELERLFLPLVYRAGLRRPTTQAQLADRERLRFSHWQVRHDSDYVAATLAAVARRLAA